MFTQKSQRGQALVLIVFAMIGLIGMVGLAVDSGSAFADRRDAQSAADNAALAAALRIVQPDPSSWQAVATSVATNNGFTNNGAGTLVNVYLMNDPSAAGCGSPLPTYTDPEEYILVTIHSTVNLFFGPIVGIRQIKNCVYAIAHGKPGVYTEFGIGSSIAAVGCTGSLNVDDWGSANVVLKDGGLFSNSSDPRALGVLKPDQLTAPSISAVGGIDLNGGVVYDENHNPVTPTSSVPPLPIKPGTTCELPDAMIPKYTCDYTYNTDFPPNSSDDHVTVSGSVVTINDAGVYCLKSDFNEGEVSGVGVTFVMLQKGIHWSGNKKITLTAPPPGSGPTGGIVIFAPYSNTHDFIFNGSAGLELVGSVFVPGASLELQGSYGANAVESQWIGKSVKLSGNLQAVFQYNSNKDYKYPAPPEIELSQ